MAALVAQHDAADHFAARLPIDDGFDVFIRGVAARVIQHHWRKRARPQLQGTSEHARALVCLMQSAVTLTACDAAQPAQSTPHRLWIARRNPAQVLWLSKHVFSGAFELPSWFNDKIMMQWVRLLVAGCSA